jgi:ATP synthase F1 delta subunit
MLPLSFDLALDIQKFRYLMYDRFKHKRSKEEIMDFIGQYLYLEGDSANAIYEYMKEQYLFGHFPHEKKIVIEHYNDGKSKHAIFHTLFGRRVNDCLSRLVAYSISRSIHKDVEIGITDNGFYIRYDGRINFPSVLRLIDVSEVRKIMENALDKTEILKRRFRHCAGRSLMILRNYKGKTKRVGRQQVSSDILYNTVRRIDEDFFLLKETKREVMEDLMDINSTKAVLDMVHKGKMKIEEFQTEIPSPFAFNMVIQGFSDIIKMEDKTEFLKRMHSYVLAKISLKDKNIQEKDVFSYKKMWEDEEKKEEEQNRKRINDDFKSVADICREDDSLIQFLAAPQIGDDDKAATVERIFSGKIADRLYDLLQLLVSKHRSSFMVEIAEEFEKLVLDRAGVVKTRLITAVGLSDQEVAAIREKLSVVTGKSIEIETLVDPGIIGGVIAIVGDKIIDRSIKHDLRLLRDRLMELKVA